MVEYMSICVDNISLTNPLLDKKKVLFSYIGPFMHLTKNYTRYEAYFDFFFLNSTKNINIY